MKSLTPILCASLLFTGCVATHHQHAHDHSHDRLHGDENTPTIRGGFKIDDRGFATIPVTDLEFANDPSDFQFAIIADNTGAPRLGVLKNALRKVSLLQPEFVISVGDLIDGFTEDETAINLHWSEFEALIDQLDMPFFYVAGNHDWSNDTMGQVWEQRYGASTYHFVYQDVLFLVLNTEEARPGGFTPGLSDTQLGYAARVLAEQEDARWTFVLMHQPLWGLNDPEGWKALEAMLAERDYTALAGHMHVYDYQRGADGQDRITLGTTGGYSLLRGKMHGEFDHVTWVTMTDDGPVIANIEIDGISDKYVVPPAIRETFMQAPVISVSPWFDESGGGPISVPLLVTNHFDHALNFKVDIFSNPDITVLGDAPMGVMAPGETSQFSLIVDAGDQSDVEPLRIRANIELVLEPGNIIPWTQDLRLAPVRREALNRSQIPITLDGDLSDWPSLPLGGGGTATLADGRPVNLEAEDGSFRFGVQYDDDHIYVGVRVRDDEVASASLQDKHNARDFAVITFDARSADLSASNPAQIAELKDGKWLMMMAAPKGETGELLFGDFVPDGFEAIVRPVQGGYVAEYQIPVAYAEAMQGENWSDLRLNVAINDIDPSTRDLGPVIMGWQPEWVEAPLGAGLFKRSED